MKKCLNCDVFVGGGHKTCPLCQNSLKGVESADIWPPMKKLIKKALFYKIQLFIALVLVIVAVCLDFLMDINDGKHYSLIIAMTIIIAEIVVRRFTKRNVVISRIISFSALYVAIILIVCGWYYGFLNVVLYYILPIMVGATLLANFVFSLIDKTENAMVYMLMNILVGIVAFIVIVHYEHAKPVTWSICVMLSVITFVGIIVFKGPKVASEIQKRMNL